MTGRKRRRGEGVRMWLLDKLLRRVVKQGELIVVDHDGKEYRYGAPEPGWKPIRVRLTDRKAAFDIASDPRLGAGEAYMDGRLVVEDGAVVGLLDVDTVGRGHRIDDWATLLGHLVLLGTILPAPATAVFRSTAS